MVPNAKIKICTYREQKGWEKTTGANSTFIIKEFHFTATDAEIFDAIWCHLRRVKYF